MILNQELLFSDAQAITADAASTNTIDLGQQGTPYGDAAALALDLGRGEPLTLLFQVVEAFNTLTSLTISVQTDDNTGFSSARTVWSHTILLANLTVGRRLPFEIMPQELTERYVRLYYDVNGTNPTTGKITAGIVHAVQNN